MFQPPLDIELLTRAETIANVNGLNNEEYNEMLDIISELTQELGANGIRIQSQNSKPSSFRIF